MLTSLYLLKIRNIKRTNESKTEKEKVDFENRSYEIQVDETQEVEFSENNVIFETFRDGHNSDCEAKFEITSRAIIPLTRGPI
jgi:hypothetical protein